MARGKRAESNGLDAANALKSAKDTEQPDTEAVEQGDDETPGVGHNSEPDPLTEDERIALTFVHKRSYEAALAVKKKADADLKNAAKLAKADLGDEAVPDIKSMIELETEEGERKFKKEVERRVRVSRWMGLPVGQNGNLFDAVDRTPGVDRAAAAGKRQGLAGDRMSCPHDPSTPQYTAFVTGYQEGQKIAFAIKPLVPAAPPATAPDEFDALDPMHGDEPPAPEAVAHS